MDVQRNSTNTRGQPSESKRHCRHSHGRRKPSIEEPITSVSPVHEETVGFDILKLDDRPSTSSSEKRPGTGLSEKRSPLLSISPRPASRRPDRPSSTRSVFEHIPGTRPASRRTAPELCGRHGQTTGTISRNSNRSRKSRAESASHGLNRGQSSDSDSDHEEGKGTTFEPDFNTVDISDEKAFDTDLEVEDAHQKIAHLLTSDQSASYDHTGKTSYIDTCKKLGVVPASYYLRHMQDRHLNMRHHGLGAAGMRALAESLSSNTNVLELDLSDNWLGPQGGLAVCEMLKDNCFITELNLSENRLGTECAPHLSQIMQQNVTLTHVTLSGNEFDDHSAPYFAEAILNSTKVLHLNLSHNNFGDVSGTILGPAIADNSCIKELDLSWNCIRRKGAVAITQGVKNNIFLKKINLSWNGFGLEGALGLQDALKGNSVLEELDISNNRITAEGAVIIGKGISVNETLNTLKMGKNPMQSAGCYGICAAILRNPNCVLKVIDFSDILVNKDFEDVFKQVQEQIPDIKLAHGGMEPPPKPKAKVHPMVKLVNYIEKHELRLVDFFNKFDKDGSMSVTHEEFVEGIETARQAIKKNAQETGIKLSDDEIEELLNELDRDGDGEINYNELVVSHVDFQEKREQINTVLTVMQPRPMTT
ncbi:leucine-rich repeat-containing protein 74B-like isoform X4 [Ruditapes philippinarum]|uniref:leucine-rich repeat-containing protein 74B-like isoform X4 n=1 Tax=Ruditapes philippinarum TaxID=129788 RepID=UPI00295BE6F8|nr:leucine-rich repeat-containing protein 74B-like isoform X4 [Ruditapes philippinarum]